MPLHSSLENGTLRFTFDEPARGNAFSPATAQALCDGLTEFDGAFREIIVAARGRFFCAGGDLAEYANMTDAAAGHEANREITRAIDALDAAPFPTLALAHGDCIGGGLELLACFDRVIASPEACFGFWQRRVGLSFGWGGEARLIRRIGEANARRLAIEGAMIGAREALRLGLIDEIAPRATFEDRSARWVARSRRWPKAPVGAFKARDPGERERFEALWWGADHRAALAVRK